MDTYSFVDFVDWLLHIHSGCWFDSFWFDFSYLFIWMKRQGCSFLSSRITVTFAILPPMRGGGQSNKMSAKSNHKKIKGQSQEEEQNHTHPINWSFIILYFILSFVSLLYSTFRLCIAYFVFLIMVYNLKVGW